MAKVMTAKEYREYVTDQLLKKSGKLGNNWCEYNGIKFQSQLERNRYVRLLKLQKKGKISKLELQPKFKILDGYSVLINGEKSKIRDITYSGDFKYINSKGQTIIEDAKGFETSAYKRTRKMALSVMFASGVDAFIEVFDDKATNITVYQKEH